MLYFYCTVRSQNGCQDTYSVEQAIVSVIEKSTNTYYPVLHKTTRGLRCLKPSTWKMGQFKKEMRHGGFRASRWPGRELGCYIQHGSWKLGFRGGGDASQNDRSVSNHHRPKAPEKDPRLPPLDMVVVAFPCRCPGCWMGLIVTRASPSHTSIWRPMQSTNTGYVLHNYGLTAATDRQSDYMTKHFHTS